MDDDGVFISTMSVSRQRVADGHFACFWAIIVIRDRNRIHVGTIGIPCNAMLTARMEIQAWP